MSTIPEQFSAASKSQVEAQLKLVEAFGTRAVDGAARLIALNIETGRAAVDSSSEALKQLASVRDPRDLIALAKAAPDFNKMMAYGREWFSIVADVQAGLFSAGVTAPAAAAQASAPAPAPAAAPAPAPQVRAEYTPAPAPAAAPAPQAHPDPAPAAEARSVKPSKKPVVALKPEPEAGPAAEEKPIAKAAGKVAGKPVSAKPAAAMPDTGSVAPHLKPVDATPPPAVFQQELLAPKRGKKR